MAIDSKNPPLDSLKTENGLPRWPKVSRKRRLIILGAGFAGLYTAQYLERHLKASDQLEVFLINKENYFLYTPMLSEVASGAVETRHILTPIRELCRDLNFIRAEVQEINLIEQEITLHNTGIHTLAYDYLVIALGSTTNLTLVPGAKDHALSMKEVSDALMVRNRIIDQFEQADLEPDPSKRRTLLTFVIAGGGFSGIEVAGSVRDMAHDIAEFYPHVDPREIRVVVIEGRDRILGELPEDLATYAQKLLQKRGIEFYLGKLLTRVTADSVSLNDGSILPVKTVIWTTGVSMEPLIACLPCAKNKQCRIEVNEYLEIPGYPGVWAIGDCALIPDLETPGQYIPPTAQHAIREADVAGSNILASIRRQAKQHKAFRYQSMGELVVLGRRQAVALIRGVKLRGFWAWFLWRTVYLWKLPSGRKKLRVAMDWCIDFFMPRDTSQVKLVPTELMEAQLHELEEVIEDWEEAASKRKAG